MDLSDGFNMGAIGISLDEEPQLWNIVIFIIIAYTKTVIVLGNFFISFE